MRTGAPMIRWVSPNRPAATGPYSAAMNTAGSICDALCSRLELPENTG